ncbi:hypothetical protein [Streptomyces flaveolus]|uniref:hypothetical protein n=1 Tax=Streptomyces flaveolus TaxID=67297 RepID=UPI003701AC98
MSPERIVVGAVRGPEAVAVTQELTNGAGGNLCAIHARRTSRRTCDPSTIGAAQLGQRGSMQARGRYEARQKNANRNSAGGTAWDRTRPP